MIVTILRKEKNSDVSYEEVYTYTTDSEDETVATMLDNLNFGDHRKGIDGEPYRPIAFRKSCLQKKCGACAMLINGKPRLACAVRIADLGENIRLEPLRKFPVVEDLVVDRSIMQENLKMMDVYLNDEAIVNEKRNKLSYEASRCLQCGLCLEVCPNYMADNGFTGMAGAMPLSRIINQLDKTKLKEAAKTYRNSVYRDCGKSLACVDVCPAEIKIEDLLVNSNAIAVWKRYIKD